MSLSFWSRTLAAFRGLVDDTLYRGSLTLLVNTVATAAIGFVFWTLAAHAYPASAVGVFSSVTSGVGLLATIAALGLPMTMIRHVVETENQRELVAVAVTAITTVGTALCLAVLLALGPHLPLALHLQQHGRMAALITALVALTAVNGTIDAGLIAIRSSHIVLVKNLIGNTVKVVALFLLVSFRSSGLLIAYGFGLLMAVVLSSVALTRRLRGRGAHFGSFFMLRRYMSFTSGTYIATIMGVLPLTVVPLEVLMIRGASETGLFAVAFLIAGFLNLIPSTVAQVLFAETSRNGVPLGRQLRKALRGIYMLLLPALAVTVASAPLLLRIFGAAYAGAATGCLRVLALSTLLTGGTYIVDSLLIARDRTALYVFMNGANAALVLGGVALLLPRGLTAAACGWAIGQGLSLVLGLLALATGKAGRHHSRTDTTPTEKATNHPPRNLRPRHAIHAFAPQIRDLLAAWPMTPTTLIAEQISWNQSIEILLDLVTELRSEYLHLCDDFEQTRYLPGQTVRCGLWFPPTEVPVGFGQTRSAWQLPVLTMVTSYSGWLSATLVPSRHPKDLLAGMWNLLKPLGAVPQALTWDYDAAIGHWEAGQLTLTRESADFCRVLGTRFVIGESADAQTRDPMRRAQIYLEHSFLPGRTFVSLMDFNVQLQAWLHVYNFRPHKQPNLSPAELVDSDIQAMIPLPSVPPPIGWHLSMNVRSHPFFRFDSNAYSLPLALIGRNVELIADLDRIRVLCDGRLAAVHDRSWARGQTIRDPAHLSQQECRLNRKKNEY